MAEREGGVMNEKAWHEIFKNYIKCYEDIHFLYKRDILNDKQYNDTLGKLLDDIIVTFKSEVE